mmetsp:Transcript_72203/g.211561  ORF Transcript_72203/g.211561 Transcript_72203/m.211561 type:complete len:294 (+) Transcript_72203:1198-2079(+)
MTQDLHPIQLQFVPRPMGGEVRARVPHTSVVFGEVAYAKQGIPILPLQEELAMHVGHARGRDLQVALRAAAQGHARAGAAEGQRHRLLGAPGEGEAHLDGSLLRLLRLLRSSRLRLWLRLRLRLRPPPPRRSRLRLRPRWRLRLRFFMRPSSTSCTLLPMAGACWGSFTGFPSRRSRSSIIMRELGLFERSRCLAILAMSPSGSSLLSRTSPSFTAACVSSRYLLANSWTRESKADIPRNVPMRMSFSFIISSPEGFLAPSSPTHKACMSASNVSLRFFISSSSARVARSSSP